MKFSENWLREWVNPAVPTSELAEQLTMAGLEVDAIESHAPGFSGVVVGEIVEAQPHPDADKLQVCRVNSGSGELLQIVCGAPNARAGLKAPLAVIGAELAGDFKIKRAKLRGVESQGMLCAGDELGIEGQGDGLWELPADAPVGADLADWLKLQDRSIEVDLTPNRSDCLGILGIAREVGALNQLDIQMPKFAPVAADIEDRFRIELKDPEDCPRYLGRVIRGVETGRPTPLWMQERLRRSGIRSIDAVVDVTNYVMLELGQPLHAFDLDRLSGGILVRKAQQGETLRLLDGKVLELSPDSLLIADADKPLALAGIMGGEDSGVSPQTRDLFLESAFFAPAALAGQARNYGLHTDASHRFERGVDPELCKLAMERATQLLLDIVGGQCGPVVVAEKGQYIPQRTAISLRKQRLEMLSGLEFTAGEIEQGLSRLGCELSTAGNDSWAVVPPSWRFDLAIEVDLIEELTRLKGYDNIPEHALRVDLHMAPSSESHRPAEAVGDYLVARGYREAITYSFIDRKLCELCGFDEGLIELQNPIASDMAIMRPSLIPGLLKTLKHNQDRQESRARLFEIGLRFVREKGEIAQLETLAGVVAGNLLDEQWREKPQKADFYLVKGELEALLDEAGSTDFSWRSGVDCSYLHPGRSATLVLNGEIRGSLGELHPAVQRKLELDGPVVLFELDLGALLSTRTPVFQPLDRFPAVHRDIAVVLDQSVAAADIQASVRNAGTNLLKTSRIFDIYTGQGIDSNKKSVALSLTFKDSSRTLEDTEVSNLVNSIIHRLESDFGAILRQ